MTTTTSPTDRFTLFPSGQGTQPFWILRDTETGKDYPFVNEESAKSGMIFCLEGGYLIGAPISISAYGEPQSSDSEDAA